jgi:prolyl oligopeptidase
MKASRAVVVTFVLFGSGGGCGGESRTVASPATAVAAQPVAAETPAPPAPAGPPRAAERPVVDDYFGTKVTDVYRWMEAPDNAELTAWMLAHDAHTRALLARIPERDALRSRLRELDRTVDTVSRVRLYGPWVFYTRREAGGELSRLHVRQGMGGAERLLYDPATETVDGAHVALNAVVPSPDGKYVALGTSPAGSEDGIIRVIETATGKFLEDRIDRVNFAAGGFPSWLDGRRFAVNRLQKLAAGAPQTERYKDIREYLHTVGQDAGNDPVLTGRSVNPAIVYEGDDSWAATIAIPGVPHAFVVAGRGTDKDFALYTAPLSKLGSGEKIPWRKLFGFEARVTSFDVRGDELYVLTHRDASRFKLLRTRLSKPDLARATVVIPEGNLILRSTVAAKDGLYVFATDRGLGRLLRLPWGKKAVETVALPTEGSLYPMFADLRRPGIVLELESWLVPRTLLAYDPARKRLEDTGLQAKPSIDVSPFTSLEVEATSADGVKVPLSIVMRKDAPLDGSQFTWLDGYGGYGYSYDPYWSPHAVATFERGISAVCHVRGGGELGDDWHQQGRLASKPNTWKDFIACAEYLVANKYTSPGKLVGTGTSMGGVMIGNAILDRPDLFAAALIRVGAVNPLRSNASANIFQGPEIGSPDTKEGFDILMAMDPYHRVKDGVAYPAVMLTAGLNDPRVVPWMVTKMAARLQAATTSGKPVLLRVEQKGGHGIGSTASQAFDEQADLLAFAIEMTR